MEWKELTITLNQEAYEAASNLLEELGARGLIYQEEGSRVKLTAYYPDDAAFSSLYQEIKEKIFQLQEFGLNPGPVYYQVKQTKDEDWSTSWHKYFQPLKIGQNFLICPSWEDCPQGERQLIRLDPGMAFGTGSHETTQMCILFLEKYVPAGINKMLDLGTGTGILAIAAAKLGVSRITAIDIDPAAVEAARENIVKNGVGEKVKVIQGDLTKGLSESFDLVVANLLPHLIMRLLPYLPPLLEKGSLLLLSGIIQEKRDEIWAESQKYGLKLIDELQKKEWVSLVLRKG